MHVGSLSQQANLHVVTAGACLHCRWRSVQSQQPWPLRLPSHRHCPYLLAATEQGTAGIDCALAAAVRSSSSCHLRRLLQVALASCCSRYSNCWCNPAALLLTEGDAGAPMPVTSAVCQCCWEECRLDSCVPAHLDRSGPPAWKGGAVHLVAVRQGSHTRLRINANNVLVSPYLVSQ